MFTLYTWGTPNGHKVSIMLEELGAEYQVRPIDIGRGDQFDPAFLALNPNHKIPVLTDSEGPDGQPVTLIESGAILVYLAGKSGRFLPADTRGKYEALQWLMFQMGSVGPMLGQAHHFLRYAPRTVPYGIQRYWGEARRIYGVLDTRLANHPYLAGPEYSIADIATWPWIRRHELHMVRLADFPNVQRWFEDIATRPAVQRGIEVPGR